MTEPLLFDSYVEALVTRAYGPRVTPRLRAALRAHELDLDAKLKPGYPARLLAPWLSAMATELFPGQPLAEAQEAIGRRFIAGWKETFLGRAIMPLVKLLDEGATISSAREPRCRLVKVEAPGAVFMCEWQA